MEAAEHPPPVEHRAAAPDGATPVQAHAPQGFESIAVWTQAASGSLGSIVALPLDHHLSEDFSDGQMIG